MDDQHRNGLSLKQSEEHPEGAGQAPVAGYPVLAEKTPEPRRQPPPVSGKAKVPPPKRASSRHRVLRIAIPLVLLLFFLGLSMMREPFVSRLPDKMQALKQNTVDRVIPLPPRKDPGSPRVQKALDLQVGPRAEPLPPGMFRLIAVGGDQPSLELDSLRKCFRPGPGQALQIRTRSPLSFSHIQVEFCSKVPGGLPGVPSLKAETGDGFQHKYTRLVPDSQSAVIDLDGEMSDRIALSTSETGQFPGFINIIPYVFVR
jgi:hypothetical protein